MASDFTPHHSYCHSSGSITSYLKKKISTNLGKKLLKSTEKSTENLHKLGRKRPATFENWRPLICGTFAQIKSFLTLLSFSTLLKYSEYYLLSNVVTDVYIIEKTAFFQQN